MQKNLLREEMTNVLFTMVGNKRRGACPIANRGTGTRTAVRRTYVLNRRESKVDADESGRVFGEIPAF